ncbi:phytoene desaturase family protein [Paenibacillus aceris]|uniref:Prolycopene isomerase n=1 Tax=Paenibacillus aceris TaxID=869555 RepID=A0ABS4I3Y0_9BACL|nr:NAD(P)/FAD-dependent oxidoreductase [Paenibacillus aceris]MBP1965609.1 prolycopene isomerase [Paenibacillus aceris]NHW36331.1 NAD(P)/FAD-dependent oxidoreductase [Paenibacillus aceris]
MKEVTIIGAGLGGLVSGAMLAKAGMKVRVLERHFIPGGYATSFTRKVRGIVRPVEFEVSLHLMGDLSEKGALREVLSEIGLMDHVEFLRAKTLYRAVFPGDDIRVGNYETYMHDLETKYPDERNGIHLLFEQFCQLRKEILLMMNKTNQGEANDLFQDGPTVLAYNNLSLQQVLDQFLTSSELKSIIAQQWQYYGLPPSQISAVYYAYAWTEYMLNGGYYPKGRSQQISNALVQMIKSHGGEVLTRHHVTQIQVENGAVKGVKTLKGEFASEVVISNVDPFQTFGKMIGYDQLPRRYVKKIESLKPSLACVQAYLLLDIDFPSVYGETDHEIFVNEYYDLEQAYEEMRNESYETMPFSITIYENLNPSYQANGKTTMSLFVLSEYDCWKEIDEETYRQKKEEVTRILINRLERLYPNVSEHIAYVELSTPRTNHAYTSNMHGAIYGAQQSVDQCLHRRLPQTTPIQGLYLAGAWTQPGGGYSGVIWSGYNLAKQLMLQNKEVVLK